MNRGFCRTLYVSAVAALLAGCGRPELPTSIPGGGGSATTISSTSPRGDRYKVLYSFQGSPDGLGPGGLTLLNGTFYGTAGGGSCYEHGCGTVFKITPSGTESVIYRFKGGSDGDDPVGQLVSLNGTLYGVTNAGGNNSGPCAPPESGCGTVFKISTTGDEHVLYRFKGGKDGDYPLAGLTSLNGQLYGTTDHGGGYYGRGTVFQITVTGKEKVLYRFQGGASDGEEPQAPLVALNGTLYGTTAYGGCTYCNSRGTVFFVSTSGGERMMYSFQGADNGGDGAIPEAGLIAINNVLYGTTSLGGYNGSRSCGRSFDLGGCGTVFSLTLGGKEQVLHRFKAIADGADPASALVEAKGKLYGTTASGGSGGTGSGGYGTVFQVTLTGKERVIHRFRGAPDGANPFSGLTYLGAKLYATTISGGDACDQFSPAGCGTVFAISP